MEEHKTEIPDWVTSLLVTADSKPKIRFIEYDNFIVERQWFNDRVRPNGPILFWLHTNLMSLFHTWKLSVQKRHARILEKCKWLWQCNQQSCPVWHTRCGCIDSQRHFVSLALWPLVAPNDMIVLNWTHLSVVIFIVFWQRQMDNISILWQPMPQNSGSGFKETSKNLSYRTTVWDPHPLVCLKNFVLSISNYLLVICTSNHWCFNPETMCAIEQDLVYRNVESHATFKEWWLDWYMAFSRNIQTRAWIFMAQWRWSSRECGWIIVS